MNKLQILSLIADDLTAVLNAEDRYQRLLEALHFAIPYDSAAILRLDGDDLVPIAAQGLKPRAVGMQFSRKAHPRLDIICDSPEPVLFPADSDLPDPFDGLLVKSGTSERHIHSCLGCPLLVREQVVGVLVFDALDTAAFRHLPKQYIQVIASLAGAQLQTVDLITALEKKAERQGRITSELMQDIQQQRGREILGGSKEITRLRRDIDLVAKSNFTILILGETGVGKELVARNVHARSRRSDQPMLYLNCAALPTTLAESELFGHVKGSFTGAVSDRTGKFELASGGTLFLDEIGELAPEVQAKLLRAIQEGEVQRVGSSHTIQVDVRLITATNRNLEQEVSAGRFRADLYHRLNVYPITVPPLREHKEDIPLLADMFAAKAGVNLGLGNVSLDDQALAELMGYHWPGNVRELENILSRAVLKASAQRNDADAVTVHREDLGGGFDASPHLVEASLQKIPEPNNENISFRDQVTLFQIQLIKTALRNNADNWAAAARELRMNRSNLHNLATRLGIRKKNPPA